MKNLQLILLLITLFGFEVGHCQENVLFDNPEYLSMVDKGGNYIYNGSFDSAVMMIDTLAGYLPEHPLIPMMRAMNEAWKDQPINTQSKYYPAHEKYIMEVIAKCEAIKVKSPDDIEALFFEMSARGLLAEYYADEGSAFKALSEAKVTYDLIKQAMELTDRSPEFYFLSGLYNYFREKYPERHPIYKPFVWVFKAGDIDTGLMQLDRAVQKSSIVKIEAALYLAYIWLRYENNPLEAKGYLSDLNNQYPKNNYFIAKLMECLILLKQYEEALPLIRQLQATDNAYYNMCGAIYMGHYMFNKKKNKEEGKVYFQNGIMIGNDFPNRGGYYRSVAFLGLGQIAILNKQYDLAEEYFEKVLTLDSSDQLVKDAEHQLELID